MPFDQHAFISYAHLDNEPLTPDQKGWVTQFHATLQTMLSQRLGNRAKIWRDQKLAGNDVFSDEIVDQFDRTALLLFVLTPRYLKSEWCTREFREFCAAALRTGGLQIGNRSRVFKIVKIPVESAGALPEAARQVLGYDFYDVDDDRVRELDPAYGEQSRQEFLRKINRLAWDLAQLCETLDSAAHAEADALATHLGGRASGADAAGARDPVNVLAARASQGTVFLAEVGRDRKKAREILAIDLESHGYEILPDAPLPLVEEDFAAAVRAQLERADLAIHLVGSSYGLVPDGPGQRSIVIVQNEIAAQLSRSRGLQRLIWLPEGVVGEVPEQKAFIETLHGDARLQDGADLLTGDLEHLKGTIHDALRRIEQARQARALRPPRGDRVVHVLIDREDRKAVVPLLKFLKTRGCEVTIPVFTGEAAALREANTELLDRCDALLLFYGSGDEAWKFHQQNEIRKQMGLRGDRPAPSLHLYLAAPRTPDKELLLSLEEPGLIDGLNGFDEAAMAGLLDAVAARRS